MASLGILLVVPVDTYLEAELHHLFNLFRLWESLPSRWREFLQTNAPWIRAVVGSPNRCADAELIDQLPNLEIVANFGVGIDKVDLPRCRERGIQVVYTPDVVMDDTADLGISLAIAALRRICDVGCYMRAGSWKDKGDYKLTSKRWRKYGNYRLSFMEHHCPPMTKRKECLVPPPRGYKPPIRWPKSKDQCWYRNVPYDWINNQKANQHWLRKEGDKFFFPGGGTMFPNGVSAYVDLMQNVIPGMKDGIVRTAIDIGCGVASWGGDLLDSGLLTVCGYYLDVYNMYYLLML